MVQVDPQTAEQTIDPRGYPARNMYDLNAFTIMCYIDLWTVNGDTNERDREALLKRLETDPQCVVLLMSIQAGSVGTRTTYPTSLIALNELARSQYYLMQCCITARAVVEPLYWGSLGYHVTSMWCLQMSKEQACGRVWRIGQKRDVTIYKLIAVDTIESDKINMKWY